MNTSDVVDEKAKPDPGRQSDEENPDGKDSGPGHDGTDQHSQEEIERLIRLLTSWFEQQYPTSEVAELQRNQLIQKLVPNMEQGIRRKFSLHLLVGSGIVFTVSLLLVLYVELALKWAAEEHIEELSTKFESTLNEKREALAKLEGEFSTRIVSTLGDAENLILDLRRRSTDAAQQRPSQTAGEGGRATTFNPSAD